MMFDVVIYTDGSCSGNPGVGGYGAIITCKGHEHIVCGNSLMTTNNQMELKAVIEAIKALKKPCNAVIHTDSQYLCSCASHKFEWFEREDRPNRKMWLELIALANDGHHKIKFVKVPGHCGVELNERCDKIAKEQCIKAKHDLLEVK